jgi:hypothetical protein
MVMLFVSAVNSNMRVRVAARMYMWCCMLPRYAPEFLQDVIGIFVEALVVKYVVLGHLVQLELRPVHAARADAALPCSVLVVDWELVPAMPPLTLRARAMMEGMLRSHQIHVPADG